MGKKTPAQSNTPERDTALIDALKFIRIAQNDVGLPHTQHCIVWEGWAYGMNGTLSAGCKIAADIGVAPHTAKLLAALERCDERVAMTILKDSLVVRSGRLRATIPCHDVTQMPNIWPDPPAARLADQMGGDVEQADKALRGALAAVQGLATDGHQRVICACVKLGPGSAQATNAHMLMEAWHGLDLPTVLIPKSSVKEVLAVKKRITQVGVSSSSFTFHFEDDSWLKTQLYNDEYPDFERLFKPSNQWPILPGFFDALKKIEPFAEEGVFFSPGVMHTEPNKELGSSIELAGTPEGRCFGLKFLLLLEGIATKIDFGKAWSTDNMSFSGPGVRGVLAPRHWQKKEEVVYAMPNAAGQTPAALKPGASKWDDLDDDIPF